MSTYDERYKQADARRRKAQIAEIAAQYRRRDQNDTEAPLVSLGERAASDRQLERDAMVERLLDEKRDAAQRAAAAQRAGYNRQKITMAIKGSERASAARNDADVRAQLAEIRAAAAASKRRRGW